MQGLLELAGVPYVGVRRARLGPGDGQDRGQGDRRRQRHRPDRVAGPAPLRPAARRLPTAPARSTPTRRRRRRRRAARRPGVPDVREARQHGLVDRRLEGPRRRPSSRAGLAAALELRRVDRRRGGRHRPRDRGRRARPHHLAPGLGARRDRARRRLLRLRGQVRRRRRRPADAGPAPRRRRRGGPGARLPGVPRLPGRGHGPRRLLLRGGRPGPAAQRAQHDPGLHARSRCTRCCGRPAASPTGPLIDELVGLAIERHAQVQRRR